MANSHRRVLIVGASIAGTVTAYWLAKAGFQITVIERAPERSKTGQGIDIKGPGLQVVQKMGLEQKIKSRTTSEEGSSIVDDYGKPIARFEITGDQGTSFTEEIEIMRGELANIFFEAADAFENVTFRYGCSLTDLRQSTDFVTVVLSDADGKAEDFDVVIGSDGLGSKTRQLTFDKEARRDCYRPQELYIAFFSIPLEKEDLPDARFQHARGGRSILLRPINKERSSCYAMHTGKSDKLFSVLRSPMADQKAAMAEVFEGVKGLGERVVKGLQDTDDFYFQQIAQVKLATWSQGRVALVGDAAYCPSSLTGRGTTLALLGAYVLGNELASNPEAPSAAFARYEEKLRTYVTNAQSIPLGGMAPRLINPQTDWGIWILRTLMWVVAWTGVYKVFNYAPVDKFQLPDYSI